MRGQNVRPIIIAVATLAAMQQPAKADVMRQTHEQVQFGAHWEMALDMMAYHNVKSRDKCYPSYCSRHQIWENEQSVMYMAAEQHYSSGIMVERSLCRHCDVAQLH
jgi:hypothetical protein